MSAKVTYTVPSVTRDEATELCVYHLRMAAALFEAVPDDSNASLMAVLYEQLRGTNEDVNDVVSGPARAWARDILARYDAMKKGG